ncbi:hypothetical protein CC80DRAFT_564444 [Byssothecium circinans]|uniref:Uncharacterized protein n=1 Tax=Byssothecium circinans TaxID=147558 RepID=A0A6A5TV55_9PLEO|nr:hypothetical protein CC80DRAFT_564444 [Byssothecium circinans]
MAPLGIISALVAAIRVAGPLWMRAIIGRARENRASVELEIMSSTSRDVGELWNGEAIVRSMGRPSVVELILIRSRMDDPVACGLYTLENAYNSSPDQPDFELAPNISLNLYPGSGLKSMIGAALVGCILQLGVLAYSGAVTFYPGLRIRVPPHSKERPHLAREGFILLACGTLILTISLVIVCNVIETSTSEKEWSVKDSGNLRVIWVQREHSVGDQQFDAAVLFDNHDKMRVLTLRRSPNLAERIKRDQQSLKRDQQGFKDKLGQIAFDRTEFATLAGTVAALVGFIAQFQGFRFLN